MVPGEGLSRGVRINGGGRVPIQPDCFAARHRLRWPVMKKEISLQLVVGLVIFLGGGIFLGVEYLLVKWYPRHEQRVVEKTLRQLPYRSAALGIEMQIGAGLYGQVEDFPGGARIQRSKFWSVGPSLTITSQPNPDQTAEFSPEVLAKWQTQGTIEEIPRYQFDHRRINGREAVLIWQFKNRSMLLTLRMISPERIIEANCTPGAADEPLFMRACEDSLGSLKILGAASPQSPSTGVIELVP